MQSTFKAKIPIRKGQTIDIGRVTDTAEKQGTEDKEWLHFVNLTSNTVKKRRNGKDQKAVRVHVMRSYLRHKNDPPFQPPASHLPSSMTNYVNRFRASPDADYLRTRHKSRKLAVDNDLSSVSENETRRAIVPRAGPTAAKIDYSFGLGSHPERPLTDPLSTLIPGTNDLLEYYYLRYWDNSLAVNPEGEWLSVALTDAAMFHATMCLVALHRYGLYGKHHRYGYFAHRGEALRILMERLSDPNQKQSDATIGAVSLISNADNSMNWSSDVQDSHLSALLTLVELRGGIDALSTNRHVKRVVSCSDIFHAAIHDTRPKLALSKCVVNRDLKPLLKLIESNALKAALKNSETDGIPAEMIHVISQLRLLAEAKSLLSQGDKRKDSTRHQIFSSILYLTERLVLEWDTNGSNSLPTNTHKHGLLGSLAGIRTMKAAVLIFTYHSFRDLAITAAFFDKLIYRLRLHLTLLIQILRSDTEYYLENSPISLLEANRTGITRYELSILLWFCLCGWQATTPPNRAEARSWFADQAWYLCEIAEVDSSNLFIERLGDIVLLKEDNSPGLLKLWQEIDYRRIAFTESL